MTGSLQEKHGKYYVVIRVPCEGDTSKRKQKWISTGIPAGRGYKRKAEQRMREILFELNRQPFSPSGDILFTDWLEAWMELKRSEVELNTIESYRFYLDKHIKPYFSALEFTLNSLKAQNIQDYYTEKRKGLSANTLKKHHVVICGALQDAVKKDILLFNPADRVTLPKIERFEETAYTSELANKLLKVIDNEPLKSAVMLGLFYGLRRSEVLGLRWRDIDFNAGTLTVKNTVVKSKTLIEHEHTKSRASRRTMSLIPCTVDYLKQLKCAQDKRRKYLRAEYAADDHVCIWPDGRPLLPDYVSNRFRKLLQDNGLPVIRFHDLRHTAGSLLLENGLSAKQIKEYLGHEKVSTTLDIYGHLSAEGKKQAAQVLDGVLQSM